MDKKRTRRRLTGLFFLLLVLASAGSFFSALQKKKAAEDSTASVISDIQTDFLTEPMKRDGQIILRLADNQRAEHPTSVACDYFARLVEKRSNGRIHIITYHSSALGDEKTVLQQMRFGGIDMVRASVALMTDYNPELTVLEMPYLYRNSDHMWQVLDGEIGNYFLQSMRNNGIEGLCWYDAGARNFYTMDKKITKLSDLKGLYIRVQQSAFMMDLVSMLGANPVEMPYEMVGSQLREHIIDGAENNIPSFVSARHSSLAPYLVLDGHTRIPEMIVMNQKVLESLPFEDQKIIRQAALESSVYQRELWKKEEEKNYQAFQEAGGTITELEDLSEFVKKVQPIYDQYVPRYGNVIERIRAVGLTD